VTTAAVIASVVLGLAFVVAGGAKLAAGDEWPAQARGLGAPLIAIPIVPWIELVVGAALVFRLIPPWPALAALVLLAAFSALIGRRLMHGEHPPCACFGAWSARPIGPMNLVRNAGLALLGLASLAA